VRRSVGQRLGILAAVGTLAACSSGPSNDPVTLLKAELAKREGQPIRLEATLLQHRDGHDVICGSYFVEASSGPRRFAAVDGRLISTPAIGPLAMACLSSLGR
jgi:hypothetical protein